MSDILVIKVNAFLKPKEMDNITRYVHDSMKTGLVVLPPYCDAQVVPDNLKVRVENAYEMKGENHE